MKTISDLGLAITLGVVISVVLILLSGCGVDVNHEGGIKTTISLDEKIAGYFAAKCRKALPPGTPSEYVDECAAASMGEFLEALSE